MHCVSQDCLSQGTLCAIPTLHHCKPYSMPQQAESRLLFACRLLSVPSGAGGLASEEGPGNALSLLRPQMWKARALLTLTSQKSYVSKRHLPFSSTVVTILVWQLRSGLPSLQTALASTSPSSKEEISSNGHPGSPIANHKGLEMCFCALRNQTLQEDDCFCL